MTCRSLPTLFLIAITGCSGGEKLVPVSGKVTLNGEPLTYGSVAFFPAADKGNTRPDSVHGQLGPGGVYVLQVGDRTGAPPGWYRVSVHAYPPPTETKGPPEPLGDPRYHDHDKSGILFEVVEKPAEGAYNIDIKP